MTTPDKVTRALEGRCAYASCREPADADHAMCAAHRARINLIKRLSAARRRALKAAGGGE